MRTRSKRGGDGDGAAAAAAKTPRPGLPPAPGNPAFAVGGARDGGGGGGVARRGGGTPRRRASPAAKGKSPAKVEMDSALGDNGKNLKVHTAEGNDDAGMTRCSRGGSEKNSLDEDPKAIGDCDAADMEWEEGHVFASEHDEDYSSELAETVTVEFTDVPSSTEKKTVRRLTAEEKELAELVHRAHLLCLLARGRVIDKSCDDPLIQASILSVLPQHVLWNSVDTPIMKANELRSLVSWFHRTFSVIAQSDDRGSFKSNLAFALQNHALLKRFVTNLDVAGLKPDTKSVGISYQDSPRLCTKALPSSSFIAGHNEHNNVSPAPSQDNTEDSIKTTPKQGKVQGCRKSLSKKLLKCKANNGNSSASVSKDSPSSSQCPSTSSNAEVPKRRGDMEFELQLEMALLASEAQTQDNKVATQLNQSTDSLLNSTPPLKKLRKSGEGSSNSSAVWSRSGAPLYWAEVFCGGEASSGRWVHVDVLNDIIDGEQKIEAASAVCRKPLRYVVAFAGNGAKDVTRRIVQGRVNPEWWKNVLAPLEQLELAATNDTEEMELQTRALTEPLPTNHHLYALEKWLHKNQVLHPKGPVLGFCKGNPVYPRSCVQTLQSRHGWLREGLQVRENELPAKVVTRPKRTFNSQSLQSNSSEDGLKPTMELYGKWQLEPLQLPHAVNGIVPKNERGQVDVWSEKCLPPGTVHLRLPRIFQVAKRLGIDFSPAMVGFDYRSGRCLPVFDGIVVCSEFKHTILEAFAEQEEQRKAEERKQEEAQALIRWYQLLSSVVTRQRLKDSYKAPSSEHGPGGPSKDVSQQKGTPDCRSSETKTPSTRLQADSPFLAHDHEHEYPEEDQSFDEETFVRTKRCPCGFSIQVEEL
uniref:Rad4 beta-hairpin domain-containing protein n=1 Tax=Leersia perrieri TaxID=77586 RepID=A0A0D9X811_9ORYZ